MDNPPPARRKMRSYTLAALLGLFVVAALLALATRLLPGGLSRLAQRALRGGGRDGSGTADRAG
jgi:hypothetical protein